MQQQQLPHGIKSVYRTVLCYVGRVVEDISYILILSSPVEPAYNPASLYYVYVHACVHMAYYSTKNRGAYVGTLTLAHAWGGWGVGVEDSRWSIHLTT